jgi:hypothetical protein
MPAHPRALPAVLVVISLASACGGGKSGTSLTPTDVQRFVAVKEATDNTTRLVALLATADQTVGQLQASRSGPRAAFARLLNGAQIGWNNVLVGVDAYTPSQAGIVTGLSDTIRATRKAAIQWADALHAIGGRRGIDASSANQLARAFETPRRSELGAVRSLRRTAATLARLACSLERAHPQLAGSRAALGDCNAAAQLAEGGL